MIVIIKVVTGSQRCDHVVKINNAYHVRKKIVAYFAFSKTNVTILAQVYKVILFLL